ncbi:4,5-DOPA dioxygenase extradiol [Propionispora vibrioides]|uniref:Aromatic ring-opening dioxygenase, catalytic subunit, LigB family n=1 Tax=Propionispora vibrioides TaxID=112903 RepID=A0A1H8Y382_9FIRM|nr:4,5-DOPA dioxygenase extradiol [Propionispora vibrioides]SEP46724.1 Aromatic ring-opening dioxygenase, catalytic subunit, LigB family [Propionispora vibrioides]
MKMPVLFIGHGSPVNILEDNLYTKSLVKLGKRLPVPQAILVVSAHWQTEGSYVTASAQPETIYDFYGFPQELYQVSYACPGSPATADLVETVTAGMVCRDACRGIDHAAWAVLKHMYPAADIPVLEMSLDVNKSPCEHYELGKRLAPLREQGVLIMGSGNIVHNLRRARFSQLYGGAYAWTLAFDGLVEAALLAGDHDSLIHYEKLPQAELAVPTDEHFLPLLYAAALQEADDTLKFTCKDMQNGSISMRGLVYSAPKED